MTLPQLNHDAYTVGWACALRCEANASRAMLDEEHQRLPQTMTTAISSAKWASITWLLHFPEQVFTVQKPLLEPRRILFERFVIFGLGLWLVSEGVLPNHRTPLTRQMIYGLGMLLLVSLREVMVRISLTQLLIFQGAVILMVRRWSPVV